MLIYLCVISCSVKLKKTNQISLGNYERSNAILTENIKFINDSIFEYTWKGWANKYNGRTNGQIKYVGGEYFLSNINEYIEIDTTADSNNINIRIISKSDSTPIVGARCKSYRKGKSIEYLVSDFNGSCTLTNTNIDKITIECIGYETIEILHDEKHINSYIVKTIEPYKAKYFTNNVVRFRDDKIIIRTKEGEITYLKTPSGNKG